MQLQNAKGKNAKEEDINRIGDASMAATTTKASGDHRIGIKGSKLLHNHHSPILKLVLNRSIEEDCVRFKSISSWEFW